MSDKLDNVKSYTLLPIEDTVKARFSFKCPKSVCDYKYEADIENKGQLGVCKALMHAHIISHLRPL